MQAIERFFVGIFGSLFNRATHSATYTVERKVRESLENQYDRALAPKEKGGGDRNA